MKASVKSCTSYGFETKQDMIKTCRAYLETTDQDLITRDTFLRQMGLPAINFMRKSTPPEIARIRRLLTIAMNEICGEYQWKSFGSRHNPQWIRVRS